MPAISATTGRAIRQEFPQERGKIVIFTICHPNGFYLGLWEKHYNQLGDTRILEQSTKDFNAYWDRVNEFQYRLLRLYDTVIFTSFDEFLVPLKHIVPMMTARPTAYHLLDTGEPPLDLTQPLLAQRQYWIPDESYSKPMIVSEPMEWGFGGHCKADQEWIPIDPDLYLIHLHRADYQQALIGHQWYATNPYVGNIQYPITEPEFNQWFYEVNSTYRKELIPEDKKYLL